MKSCWVLFTAILTIYSINSTCITGCQDCTSDQLSCDVCESTHFLDSSNSPTVCTIREKTTCLTYTASADTCATCSADKFK